MNQKYKLLGKKNAGVYLDDGNLHRIHKYFRIQALRDIPRYGVRAGDLGGLVSSKDILSHDGDAWISRDATVYGYVTVSENAYITDEALAYSRFKYKFIHVSGNAQIGGVATIVRTGYSPVTEKRRSASAHPSIIKGSVIIKDEAYIRDVMLIKDKAIIAYDSDIRDAKEISGNSIISKGTVKEGSKIINSKVTSHAVVEENVTLRNTTAANHAIVAAGQTVENRILDGIGRYISPIMNPPEIIIAKTIPAQQAGISGLSGGMESGPIHEPAVLEMDKDDEDNPELSLLREIEGKIADYEMDITKIIRYPIMTDRTDPYTVKMITALNKARRLSKKPYSDVLEQAVNDLEEKFLAAESNAVRIAASYLSESEHKRTVTAKKMFNIAGDESASEHERKTAFIQGFKQLEGVITVPEIAVDTLRLQLGFKEITM